MIVLVLTGSDLTPFGQSPHSGCCKTPSLSLPLGSLGSNPCVNTMPPAAGKGSEIPTDKSDDSGWVRVEPRSRRDTRRPHAPAIKLAPARTVHVRPVSEIDAEYQKIRAQWLESTAHTRLCQIVDAITSSNISRAVCLGIGSFDPPDGAWEAKKTAFIQFIAFKSMVDQLGVCCSSRHGFFASPPRCTTACQRKKEEVREFKIQC